MDRSGDLRVNDGLGAAFGVVSGVAGATSANGQFILLSGLAAAIASGFDGKRRVPCFKIRT